MFDRLCRKIYKIVSFLFYLDIFESSFNCSKSNLSFALFVDDLFIIKSLGDYYFEIGSIKKNLELMC